MLAISGHPNDCMIEVLRKQQRSGNVTYGVAISHADPSSRDSFND